MASRDTFLTLLLTLVNRAIYRIGLLSPSLSVCSASCTHGKLTLFEVFARKVFRCDLRIISEAAAPVEYNEEHSMFELCCLHSPWSALLRSRFLAMSLKEIENILKSRCLGSHPRCIASLEIPKETSIGCFPTCSKQTNAGTEARSPPLGNVGRLVRPCDAMQKIAERPVTV